LVNRNVNSIMATPLILLRLAYLIFLSGIPFTIIGMLCLYYMPSTRRNAAELAREPQRLTLQEFVDRGPCGNNHVIITDYSLGSAYGIEMSRRRSDPPLSSDSFGFGKAWIPLFPKGTPVNTKEEPKTARVILETSPTLATGGGLHVLSREASKEGLVVPFLERRVPIKVRETLKSHYPQTDFDNCNILVEFAKYQIRDASEVATLVVVGTIVGLALGLPTLALGWWLVLKRRRCWP
jgi:hypothetical protein